MYLISFFIFRLVFIFVTSGLALLLIALSFNLVDINQISKILNLSPELSDALRVVISRIQEVTSNLGDTIINLIEDNTGSSIENINAEDVKDKINETFKDSTGNKSQN